MSKGMVDVLLECSQQKIFASLEETGKPLLMDFWVGKNALYNKLFIQKCNPRQMMSAWRKIALDYFPTSLKRIFSLS